MPEDRSACAVGAIYQALLEELPDVGPDPDVLEKGAGPRAVYFNLLGTDACAGFSADEIADALDTQDEETLSAVAGRPIARLAEYPTALAV